MNQKPTRKQPQTESELAAYRVKLNCKIGRDCLDGTSPGLKNHSRLEYAVFCLLHAVEELAKINSTTKKP